ncbi:MAG: hypothetical protein U0992_19645 [Planctomycetaceae bacterium]
MTSLALVAAAASPAAATFVHTVSPSNGMPTNATLVSYDFTDHIGQDPGPFANENYAGPGAGNANFTNLEMNVLQQDAPFDVKITRVGGFTQGAEFFFQATLHNMTGATIDNLSIELFGNPNTGAAPQLARFDNDSNPTPSGGTFTRVSDTLAMFTNLGLAAGATTTLGYSLDFLGATSPLFGHNSDVFLQFTATPEPQGLLLGALCLAVFVGVMLQRRRNARLNPVNPIEI